jgi:hypothetical protein
MQIRLQICLFLLVLILLNQRILFVCGLSKYDTLVNSETVQDRLGKLKTHQYVLDAERLFSENDYQAVLTRLEPIFLTKESSRSGTPATTTMALEEEQADIDDFNTIGGSLSERIELMGLLYKVRL